MTTLYVLEAGAYRPATPAEVMRAARSCTPEGRVTKGRPLQYDPEFLRVYDLYPKKVAKSEAYRAWLNCGAPSIEELGDGFARDVRDYVSRARNGELAYVPFLATYLNQRRWEDARVELASGPQVAVANRGWMAGLKR